MNNSPDLANDTIHQQQRYLDPGKSYHFFISYRDIEEDNDWVINLITELQNYGFLCLDHRREFVGGQTIFSNVHEAVRSSMKTLVILSKPYTDSEFCKYELGYILHMCMDSKENLIIPVLRERCSIPECLKLVTYIDATGNINKWIPQIIKAFEHKVIERTYYQQLNPVRYYRNLDQVHKEVTRVTCFKRNVFNLKRYLPESLNDPSIQIPLQTFHGVLETLSNSNFIRCGCLCILHPIGKCCAFSLVIFWITLYFLVLLLLLSVLFKSSTEVNWPSIFFGVVSYLIHPFTSIWLPYTCFEQRFTENARTGYMSRSSGTSLMKNVACTILKIALCIFQITFTLGFILLLLHPTERSNGIIICITAISVIATSICPWYFLWYIKQVQDLRNKVLKKINVTLTEYNLLLTYKVDECWSKIDIFFVYFNCIECVNYIEDYLTEEARKKNCHSTVIEPCTTASSTNSTNRRMFNLIKDEANQLLLDLASDYIKDFIDEKLENSASPRHTKRAICLCEYAERCWERNIK